MVPQAAVSSRMRSCLASPLGTPLQIGPPPLLGADTSQCPLPMDTATAGEMEAKGQVPQTQVAAAPGTPDPGTSD